MLICREHVGRVSLFIRRPPSPGHSGRRAAILRRLKNPSPAAKGHGGNSPMGGLPNEPFHLHGEISISQRWEKKTLVPADIPKRCWLSRAILILDSLSSKRRPSSSFSVRPTFARVICDVRAAFQLLLVQPHPRHCADKRNNHHQNLPNYFAPRLHASF